MSSFGVLTTGFAKKDVDDLLAEIAAAQKIVFGADWDTTADGPAGQLNGVMADRFADLWSLGESIYNNLYPDTASGDALDRLAALSGLTRAAATQSTVDVLLNMDAAATVPLGDEASTFGGDGDKFITLATVTNGLGHRDLVAASMVSEEFGPISAIATSIDNIDTPETGWSAAALIKSGSTETYALVDGQTLTVRVDQSDTVETATFNTGDFGDIALATAAEVAVVINADISGANSFAGSGSVYIQSDLNGSGSAIVVTGGTASAALGFDTTEVKGFNAADAIPGNNLETDVALRNRREDALRSVGAASVEAILAQLNTVTGVTDVLLVENTSLLTDATGLPGKAFEAVVVGGADQAILDQIFIARPIGIESHGTDVVGSSTDTQGISHTEKFNRSTPLKLFVEVDVTVDAGSFGGGDNAQGIEEVKLAIINKSEELLRLGEDFLNVLYRCEVLDTVPGVTDVPELRVGIALSPTDVNNYEVAPKEDAFLETDVLPFTGDPSGILVSVNGATLA